MAAQCRVTKKRVNRHMLVTIEVYLILFLIALGGFLIGLCVGRATAPVKTVTIPETVTVPAYEADELPAVENVTYYDVPLSHGLQRYIAEVCADENVPVPLVMAMIEQESQFDPEIISADSDYGLMQINAINHDWLEAQYRAADMLDPYQNVFCGIKMMGAFIRVYGDYNAALMAYNMGEYGAVKARENGIESTSYSEQVLSLMEKYEQEVTKNAPHTDYYQGQ